jgi:hypothetical protein
MALITNTWILGPLDPGILSVSKLKIIKKYQENGNGTKE